MVPCKFGFDFFPSPLIPDPSPLPHPPMPTPFLTFDSQAEEAAKLYVSVFPNSKILKTSRYPEGAPRPAGSVMMIEFELDGQKFVALNAGPHFKFSDAVSFVVNCETQAEVDHYWEMLTADGGSEVACGWLKDKFGLAWQITPTALMRLISDPDMAKAGRVMQAMMKMKKIDIAAIEAAAKE